MSKGQIANIQTKMPSSDLFISSVSVNWLMSSGGLTMPLQNTYPRAAFYQMRCKDTIRNEKDQIFSQKDYYLLQIYTY